MSKENVKLNPLFAVLGAGDLALEHVNEIVSQLRARTETATESAQAAFAATRERVESLPADLPSEIEELRARFTPEELRKVAEAYIEVATGIYNSLAERGEDALGKLRAQPVVEENLSRVEKVYSDAQGLTEGALGTITAQTKLVGERAANLARSARLLPETEEPVVVKPAAKKAPAKKAPAKKVAAKKASAPAVKKAPAKKAPAKKATAK